MKVLFVCSGNKIGISPIIRNQADSLICEGVEVSFFQIKGSGVLGYLKNVKSLRKYITTEKFNLIHVHYSLSAFVASLAGAKPLVVSLMGSDVKANAFYKIIIRLFASIFKWKSIIVKSEDMYQSLGVQDAKVMPNGVDMNKFKLYDKQKSQKKLNWDTTKKHVVFPASHKRYEKNFKLASDAIDVLNESNVELHYFEGVHNSETPIWYGGADVVLLTSLWEGSPNVIKETMACNRPIVSTNVGDVEWVMGDTEGCYICSYDPQDCADKIRAALEFSQNKGQTDGRKRIEELGLDNKIVAKKIVEIYTKVISKS